MKRATIFAIGCSVLLASMPSPALAHCDSLDGPVVKDARLALQGRDLAPALKWVAEEAEGEVRAAFAQALVVRGLGPKAEALADRYFFETLVRLHREGEGAPYTGLKPAGTPVGAAVAEADRALETGSVEELARLIVVGADHGLRRRFERALALRRQAGLGPEQGRAYVAAYVEFVHYAERLDRDAAGEAGHDDRSHGESEH